MPNYSLVINSQFKPFSYQDMLAPTLMATQAHQELEDLYGEVGDEAATVAGSINPITDKDAYARYKGFEDALRAEADTLASEGLNPSSRRTAQLLRSRYKKDITPIETAIKNRYEKAKEQRAGRMNDDTIMYDRDFSTISLDELIKNPDLGYTAVSGNTLYKQGMQAAAAASSRNIETLKALGNQYWQIRQGYGSNAANKFLLDNSNIPELKDAINRIVSQSGITDNNKDRAIDYTINGIMAGLTYDESYQANRGYISPAEAQRLAMERKRLEMQKERQDWAREQKDEATKGMLLPNGNRLKAIGAGRVIEIALDGSYKLVSFPSSSTTASGVPRSTAEKQNTFTTLEYTGSSFDSPGWSDKFSESDAKLITFNELSPKARKKLQEDLAKYRLSVADVDIYEDQDYFSKNHYRVTKKGTGIAGVDVSTTEQQQNEGL